MDHELEPLTPLDEPAALEEPSPLEAASPAPIRVRVGRRGAIVTAGLGALVLGGAVVATSLGGAATALAASSTASPSPSTSTSPWSGRGDHGFLGPNHEAVSDTSVAAKAIGISEADLIAALGQGQTMAAVAKAHNVDVQQVIDALVADANDEIATAVKNGTMTQAQADTEKAGVTARVTAQVNGTFGPGMGGPRRGDHGFGPGFGPGGSVPNGTSASPAATPNA